MHGLRRRRPEWVRSMEWLGVMPLLTLKFSDNATGVARREYSRWDILYNDTSSPDHCPCSNA